MGAGLGGWPGSAATIAAAAARRRDGGQGRGQVRDPARGRAAGRCRLRTGAGRRVRGDPVECRDGRRHARAPGGRRLLAAVRAGRGPALDRPRMPVFLPGDVRRAVEQPGGAAREPRLGASSWRAVIAGVAVGRRERCERAHRRARHAAHALLCRVLAGAGGADARPHGSCSGSSRPASWWSWSSRSCRCSSDSRPRLFLIAAAGRRPHRSRSDATGFLRVRPPGLTTVYIVAAFALARVLWGPARQRLLGWGMAAVTLTGVILSLNRNMLLGLALGLCAAAVIAPQRHRFVVMAATLGMVLSGFVLLAQGSAARVERDRLARRKHHQLLGAADSRRSTTATTRTASRCSGSAPTPIGGLGWGPDYGAVLLSSDDGFLVSQPRPFMHEQYLWIWMRAGLIGLLALIAMLALGHLERRALVPGEARKGRRLAGGGRRGGARRDGGQLERRHLPHAARLDRAPGRRARARGRDAARSRAPVSDRGTRTRRRRRQLPQRAADRTDDRDRPRVRRRRRARDRGRQLAGRRRRRRRRARPRRTRRSSRIRSNRGYAAAVNQAVAVSRAEVVLLLNPDVRARSREATRTSLEAFARPARRGGRPAAARHRRRRSSRAASARRGRST